MTKGLKYILLLWCSLCCFVAVAQPQTHITSFPYSIVFYNPAYSGAIDHVNVSLIHKSQWLNHPGGPSLQGVGAHLPMNYERLGLGLNMMKESAGIVQSLYANANASYKINFHNGRLSFGLRLGMLQRTEDVKSLVVKDQDDRLLSNTTELKPEAGGGLFYKDPNFYVGLSFTRSAGIYLEQNSTLKNYYVLMGGFKRSLSPDVILLPAIQLRYTGEFDPYVSFIVPVEYKKIVSVGTGYSSAAVFSALASLNIDQLTGVSENRYCIAYTYDQSLSKKNGYLGNTHEITLVMKLVPAQKADKILKRKVTVSPLFFD